jgi:hypothetical protein
MALAVTSGLSKTCAVSGLVTHYIIAHDHTNLRKEAPMLHVGATGTNNKKQHIGYYLQVLPQTSLTFKPSALYVISDFRRDVDEICALLRCYAASSHNPLPTFRDNV